MVVVGVGGGREGNVGEIKGYMEKWQKREGKRKEEEKRHKRITMRCYMSDRFIDCLSDCCHT